MSALPHWRLARCVQRAQGWQQEPRLVPALLMLAGLVPLPPQSLQGALLVEGFRWRYSLNRALVLQVRLPSCH